ncbi:MAG: anthranilate phosphoribosyltransferase [Deltaproteobacteria bacterium]|nr:anthranilate phosphoribosyltransferase [Deltaproteobacteria bacterium]
MDTPEIPQDIIRQVAAGRHLTVEQAAWAMNGIMGGQWTPAQIGAYLTALHMKGETLDEIVGSARVMREKAFKAPVKNRPLVDTAGTGGDGLRTVNVSTLAALVAAGAGARVSKHGNRAVTGMCGSADILEGLGVNLDISPEDAVGAIDEAGFGFLFAPHFHQSMKHAVAPRKEIGIPSVFNLLGPLTSPLGAEGQLIGVAKPAMARLFTDALMALGTPHSLVVSGADGMDEITNTGETQVLEQRNGKVTAFTLTPEQFGCKRVQVSQLTLKGKEQSIALAKDLLAGKADRATADLVLLNAAAAIYLGGKAQTLEEGFATAKEALESGKAQKVLERLATYTQSKKKAG